MRKKLVAISLLALCSGLFAAWYLGELDPLYAGYPERLPFATVQPNTQPLIWP